MDLTYLFMSLGMLILIVTIIIGIERRIWKDSKIRFIFFSCLISLLCDVGSILLGLVLKKSTIAIIHFWAIFELVILSAFFLLFYSRNLQIVKLIVALVGMFSLYNILFIQSEEAIAWYSNAATALMFIGFSVKALGELFRKEESMFITKSPYFWIIIGLIIYFSGSLYTTLYSAKIFAIQKTSLYGMWYLHNAVLAIKNAFFGIAFYKALKH